MIKFIKRCGVDYEKMRVTHLGKDPMRFQFDSARKRMSTILDIDDEKTEHGYPKRLHIKGASEIILTTCTHYLGEDGEKKPLNDDMVQSLNQQIKDYAKCALRTIAFGYKDLKEGEGGKAHEDAREGSKIRMVEEGDFTLICIAGIKDIIRAEVPEAVIKCNEAGVRVRMITGDNKITAIAIALECGIILPEEKDDDQVCMEGPQFY
jgi:Ca2+ transporting ATPase